MDPTHFDALTRALTRRAASRRALLPALGGGVLALGLVASPAAEARKKRCGGGKKRCDGRCVNLQTNAKHCGACGNACGANRACEGGECVAAADRCSNPAVCNTEYVACGTTAGSGDPCSCERTAEGNTACINFIDESCANFQACATTQDCRETVGFHFFCQEIKGCGCSTTTKRCMPECDNPNP